MQIYREYGQTYVYRYVHICMFVNMYVCMCTYTCKILVLIEAKVTKYKCLKILLIGKPRTEQNRKKEKLNLLDKLCLIDLV